MATQNAYSLEDIEAFRDQIAMATEADIPSLDVAQLNTHFGGDAGAASRYYRRAAEQLHLVGRDPSEAHQIVRSMLEQNAD